MTSAYTATMRAFHETAEELRLQGAAHLQAFDRDRDCRHLVLADDCRMRADAMDSMARAAA